MWTVSQALRTMGLVQALTGLPRVATRAITKTSGKMKTLRLSTLVAPVHAQIDHRHEEGAHRERLVEVGDGAAVVDDAFFHDGDEVEDGAQGEGGQGDAEEVLAAANQGKDGVQQAERIERGGHAQPDDAHFSHGRNPVTLKS